MMRRGHLAAALVLALVAGLLLAPLLRVGSTHILTDEFQAGPGRSDAFTFLWGQWWVHTALSAGRSPFSCDRVFPPEGADVRFHSILWAPALASWPVAALFGEVPAYNATIAALLLGAAIVMYLCLRITFGLPFVVATARTRSPRRASRSSRS
jgi:hypothetical protein